MTVCVISLGCPKNLVDSEHMLGYLARAGFQLSSIPEESDVIIVNTCGFLASAVNEAEQVIRRCLQYKRTGQVSKVIVAGCLVQRLGERLRTAMPDVDAWIAIDDEADLPEIISGMHSRNRTFASGNTKCRTSLLTPALSSERRGSGDPISLERPLSLAPRAGRGQGEGQSAVRVKTGQTSVAAITEVIPPQHLCTAASARLVSTPAHYAYLRIADGCDNCCSYCLIPSIRGRFRSRPIEDVVREAKLLAKGGARELILIAQDTTLYGQDRYGRKMLAALLRRLAAIRGIDWLRVMYTHPAHFTAELIDEMALNDRVVKYVDLPLQHINDRLLRRMNRPYQRMDVEALLSRLHAIPGMAIRTTMITGFPGETGAEFQELREFVAEGHFAHLGCFAFSPEPGAAAYHMSEQLPSEVREQRAREIMHVQRRVSLRRNRALVGKNLEVVIDGKGSDPSRRAPPGVRPRSEYVGRTATDAPEIDNTVHVSGKSLAAGKLLTVHITRAGAYDLFGKHTSIVY